MGMRRDSMCPGAYCLDPKEGVLYEVTDRQQLFVGLVNCRDPAMPDRCDEHRKLMRLDVAEKRLRQVFPAPSPEEWASVEEWGGVG